MRRIPFSPLISILLLFPSLVLAEEIAPEDWLVDRRESSQPLEGVDLVAVTNRFGEIRMRTHAKNEIYVLINAQRHRDDPVEQALRMERKGDRMQVEVSYPPYEGDVPDSFRQRRIDMTVFVPSRVNARFETEHGKIQARGLKGHLDARSVRGVISVRAGGSADLVSEHGAIDVIFLDTRWSQDSRVETITAPIRASLVSGGAARAVLESHGTFTTDYTLEVERDPDTGHKKGRAQIGENGRNLLLKSDRGSISLLSSMIPQPD